MHRKRNRRFSRDKVVGRDNNNNNFDGLGPQSNAHFSSMAFRKRNVAAGRAPAGSILSEASEKENAPGIRTSYLTSHPITSTGTASLDALLGGHGGLPLGSSLLVEESGTTDFAGALLKYYAAQGICHGHFIHVVGVGEIWVRGLPGIAEERSSTPKEGLKQEDDKMKIAWRYENLGKAGERGA